MRDSPNVYVPTPFENIMFSTPAFLSVNIARTASDGNVNLCPDRKSVV